MNEWINGLHEWPVHTVLFSKWRLTSLWQCIRSICIECTWPHCTVRARTNHKSEAPSHRALGTSITPLLKRLFFSNQSLFLLLQEARRALRVGKGRVKMDLQAKRNLLLPLLLLLRVPGRRVPRKEEMKVIHCNVIFNLIVLLLPSTIMSVRLCVCVCSYENWLRYIELLYPT